MNDEYKEQLQDLKNKFGSKVLLTIEDISLVMPQSENALRKLMRKGGLDALPRKKIGNIWYINIYKFARFLVQDDDLEQAPTIKKQVVKVPKSLIKKSEHRGISLGKSLFGFNLRIQEQYEKMEFMKLLFAELESINLANEVRKDLKKRERKVLGGKTE